MLLTVTAGLDGSLNVADALHSNTVLVVAVDVLILQLSDLVQQDTKLVSDIGHVFIRALSPDGQLLLCSQTVSLFHGRRAEDRF